jgi:hypothetical protein
VAQRIFDWAEEKRLRVGFGKGINDGSFQPVLDDETGYAYPFALYTNGAVEIPFQWMLRFPQKPFDRLEKRKEFQVRLNALEGVALPDDRLEKRPSFPLQALVAPGALEAFFEAVEWFFDEAREARSGGFAKPV